MKSSSSFASQFCRADRNSASLGSPTFTNLSLSLSLSPPTNFPASQPSLLHNFLKNHTKMGFPITRSTLSPLSSPFFFTSPANRIQSSPPQIHPNPSKTTSKTPPILRYAFNPTSTKKPNPQKRSSLSCFTINNHPMIQTSPSTVSEKVQSLDFEFKSLPKPIDRVKRLLHYATILPPFDESSRIHENRVSGCTTQVWLEVKMERNGVMRFRVDSDSEITKGFCSCLIWVLDGAEADEVLSVRSDDLVEMNVGLPRRGHSRVNAWHNVLISMQRRTRDLVEDRGREKLQSY